MPAGASSALDWDGCEHAMLATHSQTTVILLDALMARSPLLAATRP
jgi:hypothetical protein